MQDHCFALFPSTQLACWHLRTPRSPSTSRAACWCTPPRAAATHQWQCLAQKGQERRSEGGAAGLSRRAALAQVLLVVQQLWGLGPSVWPPREAAGADGRTPARGAAAALPDAVHARHAPARRLLESIPVLPFDAPATNVTIDPQLAQDIERQAAALEQGTRDLAASDELSGSWRLLYSNGREIRNLASGLPLGFALGRVYQPVDTAGGRFENQGAIEHIWGWARASNCVIGDVRVAPLGTVNAAGTINSAGNRVDVDFRRITFSLDEIFGRPVSFRKVIVTKQAPAAAQPANDVTYLDETLRITRGGDDSLFIFRREASPRALLTAAEREALYAEGGNEATLFGSNGVSSASAAPELRKLIDE